MFVLLSSPTGALTDRGDRTWRSQSSEQDVSDVRSASADDAGDTRCATACGIRPNPACRVGSTSTTTPVPAWSPHPAPRSRRPMSCWSRSRGPRPRRSWARCRSAMPWSSTPPTRVPQVTWRRSRRGRSASPVDGQLPEWSKAFNTDRLGQHVRSALPGWHPGDVLAGDDPLHATRCRRSPPSSASTRSTPAVSTRPPTWSTWPRSGSASPTARERAGSRLRPAATMTAASTTATETSSERRTWSCSLRSRVRVRRDPAGRHAARRPQRHGLDRAALLLWLVWWAWSQYTWARTRSTWSDGRPGSRCWPWPASCCWPRSPCRRRFADVALWFVVPYVAVRLAGLALYWLGTDDEVHRAALRTYLPVAAISPVLVLVGGPARPPHLVSWWCGAWPCWST